MEKRYILKTTTQWVNTTKETPLDDFSEEDFKRYNGEGLSQSDNDTFLSMAIEDQGLEWWIEEEEEEEKP